MTGLPHAGTELNLAGLDDLVVLAMAETSNVEPESKEVLWLEARRPAAPTSLPVPSRAEEQRDGDFTTSPMVESRSA